jgi:FixJ family two-component response regulator
VSRAAEAFRADLSEVALLITDLVLSDCAGDGLAAALVAKNPHLRVLFMTGYFAEGPLAGPVLQKPFLGNQLLEQVRQILDGTGPTGDYDGLPTRLTDGDEDGTTEKPLM